MKAFLTGIVFLALVAVGAFMYLKYFSPAPADPEATIYKTAPITKSGELRKTNVTASDFTHVLVAGGESVGVASYNLNLDDYIGKQVKVTGQYSGTTLYADIIQVLP